MLNLIKLLGALLEVKFMYVCVPVAYIVEIQRQRECEGFSGSLGTCKMLTRDKKRRDMR